MPLTGTGAVLGASLKSAIHGLTDEQKRDPDAIYKAMGEAIIAHIIANGTGAVASVSGVTTGPGVSGPGALI